MAHKVVFPQLDVNIEEGTIGKWLKTEGDRIEEKEPIVEIITDKATFEYESPVAGTLLKIIALPRSVVPIGYTLAIVGEPNERPPDVEAENEAVLKAYREKHTQVSLRRGRRGTKRVRVRATPAARRVAREAGVDLTKVPTEHDGPIQESDVQKFIDRSES